jgi:hypothetical protein
MMNVSDKLSKVNDTVTVNIYDNGFMIEVSGRDHDDEWSQAKIVCSDLDIVNAVLQEIVKMDKS